MIHRDVKPSNILVRGKVGSGEIQVKLTDFGVGQVVAQEVLADLTRMGFTRTMMEGLPNRHANVHGARIDRGRSSINSIGHLFVGRGALPNVSWKLPQAGHG